LSTILSEDDNGTFEPICGVSKEKAKSLGGFTLFLENEPQ